MSAPHLIAAVAAALLIALVAARRRRLGPALSLAALAAAVVLAVYASGVLEGLPDPEQAIADVATTLGDWTYVLVGTMAFLETGAFVGFIAPGEVTVILGGVIAGQGEIELVPLIGIAWACSFMGDTVSFLLGHTIGRGAVLRHGPRVKITRERFEAVERYFDRHGGKTIVLGRFLGFVRPLLPFIAGSSQMRYSRFLPYSVTGTGLWSSTFCLLGFFFYRSFTEVADIAGGASLLLGTVVTVAFAVAVAIRRLRHAEERERLGRWLERHAERPALRPLAALARPVWRRAVRPAWRFAAPQLRFVAGRLTPGNLGIELTTVLAVTAVGAYVFVLYAVTFSGDRAFTPADRELYDLAQELHTHAAVEVVRAVTWLGALPVVAAQVAFAAAILAWRRHPAELAMLVLGFAAVFAAVQLVKVGIDRPRPADPLTGTSGPSFPSGHAAYATVYVALAALTARVFRGFVSRASLVIAALAIAAAVGLSRVYLNAHYWSDVVAGWGLGFAVFGAVAAATLVTVHIRNNLRRPAGAAARPDPGPPERAPAGERG